MGIGPLTRSLIWSLEVHKGGVHAIAPFVGRKNGTLTAHQQSYNDVCVCDIGHGLRGRIWRSARLVQASCNFLGVWPY